jgi:hypothetical protein
MAQLYVFQSVLYLQHYAHSLAERSNSSTSSECRNLQVDHPSYSLPSLFEIGNTSEIYLWLYSVIFFFVFTVCSKLINVPLF